VSHVLHDSTDFPPNRIAAFHTLLNNALEEAATVVNDVVQTPLLATPAAFTVGGISFVQQLNSDESAQMVGLGQQYRVALVSARIGNTQHTLPQHHGGYVGSVMIAFSSDRAAKLALLMLSDEYSGTDMDALRNSVFLETSNILINGVLQMLAQYRPNDVYSVPTYTEVISDELFSSYLALSNETLMIAQLDCTIENHTIHGQILLLLTNAAWQTLLETVQ
jgi:hypothetical protein